jgi:signal transduction histidine kinase/ActR/RegA family two-component response regulator
MTAHTDANPKDSGTARVSEPEGQSLPATRLRQLETIRAISAAATQDLELPELLRQILRSAQELVGAAGGVVALWSSEEQCLAPQVWDPEAYDWIGGLRQKLGEGLFGLTAARRTGMILNDYRTSPAAYPSVLQHSEITAAVAEPLLYRGKLLGVIALHNGDSKETFAPQALEILSLLAPHAAIAIETAQLHRDTLRQVEQLGTLASLIRTITTTLQPERVAKETLAAVQVLFPGTAGRIWERTGDGTAGFRIVGSIGLQDPAGGHPPLIHEGGSLGGVVARTREPAGSPDLATDPRFGNKSWAQAEGLVSGLLVPMVQGKILQGVMSVFTREPRTFSDAEVTVLRSFADHATIAMENARLFRAAQQELTERRRAEIALAERTRQLEVIRAISEEITRELDLKAVLNLITRRAVELVGGGSGMLRLWDEPTGYLVGQSWVGLQEGYTPVSLKLGEGVAGAAAQEHRGLLVNDFRRSPYATAQLLKDSAHVAVLAEPLLYRDRLIGVISVNREDPGQPFVDEDRQILALFAAQAAIAIENARLFEEVTKSYQALQEAQAESIRNEKLRALGQMSAGIAHDLNNTLATVLGQVELLRLRVTDPDIQESLAILETAASDGAQVVRRLQDFGRQRRGRPLAPVDLGPVVQETLEITRPRWKDEPQRKGSVIHVHPDLSDLPPILGYAPEIREALTNLIFNAVDAMPQGGTLAFSGREVPSEDPRESWVELAVTDTGIGIPDSVRTQIFDPFFTTKGPHGTGLGLSVVYSIMERHGGRVDVSSVPGRGTTFRLRFQRAVGQAEDRSVEASVARVAARRLLLVDDDPAVRMTLGSLLRAAGHTVLEAEGGTEGVRLLADAPPDLVITDLGMPEVSGWDVARVAKSRYPTLPVILLTGWGEEAASAEGDSRSIDRILGKPVRLQELLATVEELTVKAATGPA